MAKHGGTTSTRPRTRKGPKIRSRSGAKVFVWRLQDDVFFERFEELGDAQIRFYLGLRKSWMARGGAAVIIEERTPHMMAELADAAKDVERLIDEGFIVREDAPALAVRIKAERPSGAVRATN